MLCFAGDECFERVEDCADSHHSGTAGTIPFQQLLPTKVCHQKKTGTHRSEDVKCRMWGKAAKTQAQVLAGFGALAQSKYMIRHNAALKVIFYELLKDLDFVTTVPPWYSQNMPKPLYENKRGKINTLGHATICRTRRSEKQQDRSLYGYRQGEEESSVT